MIRLLRFPLVIAALLAVFGHEDDIVLNYSATAWTKVSAKLHESERDEDRRQRELLFLKAAYDRLQSDLDSDPDRRGAASLRAEQEVLVERMRETAGRKLPLPDLANRPVKPEEASFTTGVGSGREPTPSVVVPLPQRIMPSIPETRAGDISPEPVRN